jgi:hypothetical protein
VSADEQRLLGSLERVLVGAAAEQAGRLRRRRRRAIILVALSAPLLLAAAASTAKSGFFLRIDRHLSTLRDDRLQAPAGSATRLEGAMGVKAGAKALRWRVAGQQVIGYTTPGGRFCFTFVGLTGGCLSKDTLSPAEPVDVTTDNGAGEFRIYGLVVDGVKALSLRVHGVTRRVAVAHNAFFLSAPALSREHDFDGVLLVRMADGTTLRKVLHIGGTASHSRRVLPRLPGSLPAEDAAA